MKKYLAVEIDPPADCDASFLVEAAARVRKAGADTVTLADNPFAKARADSAMLACKVTREAGIRAIPHLTCRDRNYNALKSTLLGLAIEGIDTVLAVTGDPVRIGDNPYLRSRADFDSRTLAGIISQWNETDFYRPFTIAGALNVNAPSFSAELERAARKAKAGMSVFFTQPVIGEKAAANVRRAREALPRSVMLVAGILPIVSFRNAEYLESSIAGIKVDREIAERYRDVSKEEATELATSISVSMMERVSNAVDGFCLITPFKRIDIVESIIARSSGVRAAAGVREASELREANEGSDYLSLAI